MIKMAHIFVALLLVVLIGLWVDTISYTRIIIFFDTAVFTEDGAIYITRTPARVEYLIEFYDSYGIHEKRNVLYSTGGRDFFPKPGFVVLASSMAPKGRHLVIPFWLVIVILGPIWIAMMYLPIRRRQLYRQRGCCLDCGYDLTGNESGACPECNRSVVGEKGQRDS